MAANVHTQSYPPSFLTSYFWKLNSQIKKGATHATQDSKHAFLQYAAQTYLSFADDEEGVSSCTLPDDIFSIFIVGLKNSNSDIKQTIKKLCAKQNMLSNTRPLGMHSC